MKLTHSGVWSDALPPMAPVTPDIPARKAPVLTFRQYPLPDPQALADLEAKVLARQNTLDNPRPDVQITSLDYLSVKGNPGPFLAGITIE